MTSNGVGCRNFDAGRKNAFLIPGKLTLHAVPKASLTKRLIVLTTLSRIFAYCYSSQHGLRQRRRYFDTSVNQRSVQRLAYPHSMSGLSSRRPPKPLPQNRYTSGSERVEVKCRTPGRNWRHVTVAVPSSGAHFGQYRTTDYATVLLATEDFQLLRGRPPVTGLRACV